MGSASPGVGADALSTAQALDKLTLVMAKLDGHLIQLAPSGIKAMTSLPSEHEVHNLIRQAGTIAACAYTRDESALAMVQRIFKRMYEQAGAGGRLYTQVNVHLILAIHHVSKKVSRFVSDLLFYSDDDHKLHGEVVGALLHAGLLSMTELATHLAKHMDGGRNFAVTQFAIRLLRTSLLEEQIATSADCAELLQALSKLLHLPTPPDGLVRLLEDAAHLLGSSYGGLAVAAASSASLIDVRLALTAISLPDTPENDLPFSRTREQVAPLWDEWFGIYEQPSQRDKAHDVFMSSLATAGWLRPDTQRDHFLRALIELSLCGSVSHTSSSELSEAGRPAITFAPLDALSTLIVLIIKHIPRDASSGHTISTTPAAMHPQKQITLLSRIISLIIQQLLRGYETRPQDFNQRAYLRIFGSVLFELNVPDPILDIIRPQALSALAAAFLALQPSRLPGFAFAWLELISHRMFMPKTLLAKNQRGWTHMLQLLVGLFTFLRPHLSAHELSAPIRTLYRGALRVLLVLLHDFPEFLCDYHLGLCEVIPPSCIQMRNLVLSAFPRNMRLPDPFTPNLKIDLLPEIWQPPRMLAAVNPPLLAVNILADLDSFLDTRQPASLLLDLRVRLTNVDGSPRVALLNALLLRVGKAGAAAQLASRQPLQALVDSPFIEIYQRLLTDLSAESRYAVLNGMANQLRYPNSLTHFFSSAMLHLFHEANDHRVQEQITRILVERLIVHRPHPWGLLITFIELIKNPRFGFWSKGFTRCAPEIERLFESVARSCMAPGSGSGALAQTAVEVPEG